MDYNFQHDAHDDVPGMPEHRLLDAISMSIAKVPYDAHQSPDHKALIFKLAVLAGMSCDTREIVDRLDALTDAFKESAAQQRVHYEAAADAFTNVDHELTKIGDWFKHSRTFDGLG